MKFKRSLLFLILIMTVSSLRAQTVNFFKGSFEEAKAEAKKHHKLVYVFANIEVNNKMLSSPGQSEPDVLKRYEADFICCYKSHSLTGAPEDFIQQYNVVSYPTHLFFDENGSLILKTVGYRSSPESYLNDMNTAVKLSKTKTLGVYATDYKKGNRDLNFLKSYLLKFDELDIPVNQVVLDEYVNLLPVNALDDYQTILFISERGPVLSGKAYKVSRLNPILIDSMYKVLPLDKRIKMNNRIITYSMREARDKKDEKLAILTANFVAGTWQNNYLKASSARSAKMMDYYRDVNDTVKYLNNASLYYQSYYLSLRDSIQKPGPIEPFVMKKPASVVPFKKDTINKTSEGVDKFYQGKLAKEYTMKIGTSGGAMMNSKDNSRFKAMEFAMNLNNGAYSIYTMHTKNPEYLNKAVIWVRRSIELFPDNSAYYDTLSHLLYVQKKYDEAVGTQQKAIEVMKAERSNMVSMLQSLPGGRPMPDPMITNFQNGKNAEMERLVAELAKMKSRTL